MSQVRALTDLLPDETRTYRGDSWVSTFLVLLSVVTTIRSIIHIARHDGEQRALLALTLMSRADRIWWRSLLSRDWCSYCWQASPGLRSVLTED